MDIVRKLNISERHKIIILPVVLHGGETLNLTIREEHRKSAFEKRVLRKIFRPRTAEVIEGWRHLHN
jgi:hypothetical protein